jgi:hypothetical protein
VQDGNFALYGDLEPKILPWGTCPHSMNQLDWTKGIRVGWCDKAKNDGVSRGLVKFPIDILHIPSIRFFKVCVLNFVNMWKLPRITDVDPM